jgi:hypothetical protein
MNDAAGMAIDPQMPFLGDAISPPRAAAYISNALGRSVIVKVARLLRHKPGRRALVEYRVSGHDGHTETLLGKVRAKGVDRRTFELQSALFSSSFAEESDDGLSVPEPLALVPELNMWLQRSVPGAPLTNLLSSSAAPELCARAASLVHKLHTFGPQPNRVHTITDELGILRERLSLASREQPSLAREFQSVLAGCEHLANALMTTGAAIHRDFYPDQVLVSRQRMYLLDLDLYCIGDPALDGGNFIAHLLEHSLRYFGSAQASDASASAFRSHFLSLNPGISYDAVESWATLSLARHVQLSTQFPSRRHLTRDLLAIVRDRLRSVHNV